MNNTATTVPQLLLFDIDGVVVPEGDVYFSGRLQEELDIPPEEVETFFRDDFLACLRGEADMREELSKHMDRWGWPGTVDDILSFWFEAEKYIDPQVVDVIDALREKGIPCYIASNQEKYRAQYLWNEVRLKDHFDGAFFSHHVGVLKDDMLFFEYVLENLDEQVSADEILFWDNMEEYVRAAQKTGIHSKLYTSFNELYQYVDEIEEDHIDISSDATVAVVSLVRHYFPQKLRHISHARRGETNNVFQIDVGDRRIIAKLHKERKRTRLFQWQQYVLERLTERDIPTPITIAIGSEIVPFAYMLYSKISGTSAIQYESNREKVWNGLGSHMREIHDIDIEKYGHVRYWEEGKKGVLFDDWGLYISDEINRALDPPNSPDMPSFIKENADKIRDRFNEMKEWEFKPSIIHGDLTLENVLVDIRGNITGIIDWDEMVWAKAPEWEFAATFSWLTDDPEAPHYISPEEIDAFLDGYGISKGEYEEMQHDMDTIKLLRYCIYGNYFYRMDDEWRLKDISKRAAAILENT